MENVLRVRARWLRDDVWQRIVAAAPKKDDDAALRAWWAERTQELPLIVDGCAASRRAETAKKSRTESGKKPRMETELIFTYTTDVLAGLARPINRPRCELQAAYKTLQAVLRRAGGDGIRWHRIELNVNDSLYLANNATRPRMHTWYKNAYKGIANRDLWENLRLCLDRLHGEGIECRFVSSLPQEDKRIDAAQLFSKSGVQLRGEAGEADKKGGLGKASENH